MKFLKNALVLTMIFVIISVLSACSGADKSTTDSASQATIDSNADDVAANVADSQTAVAAPASSAWPAPDPNASVDSLLGSWVNINAADRFANITKTDTGYSYEDNEGSYEATFKDGTLIIKVSDTDSAEIYFDAAKNRMISIYQEGYSEFKKK